MSRIKIEGFSKKWVSRANYLFRFLRSDIRKTAELAHMIKGTAANVRVLRVQAKAFEIEKMTCFGETIPPLDMIDELERGFDAFRSEIGQISGDDLLICLDKCVNISLHSRAEFHRWQSQYI